MSVSNARIKKSLVDASFDENGVSTIKAGSPFDKLPEWFISNTLKFIFVFQKRRI
ncbi:MAG: hypothetical protein LBB06_02410 [Endomicrobium sp.]|nr:hypothetical protein [Endomicrobium sp.]